MNTLINEAPRGQTSHQPMNNHEDARAPGDQGISPIADDVAKNMVQLFKLLSDETRLRILFYLKQREEVHVRGLCELLKQSQPAVSHHLALLRVAGLIEARRDGKHNFYRILPARFAELKQMFFSAMPADEGREWLNR